MRHALLLVALSACAGFQRPEPFDLAPLREGAVTHSREGVRASAALLTDEQIDAVFGVDLEARDIQPVWIEIENDTERPLFVLLTGVDPEYFAPFEVSRAFHRKFAGDSNRELDDHIVGLALENRPAIRPGETVDGFVYTNVDQGMKVLDVDLLGEQWMNRITLFVPDPDLSPSSTPVAQLEMRFSEPELVQLAGLEALREAIAGLPCCAADADGRHVAPLNLAVIGQIEEWMSAGLHRGYRRRDLPPLEAFLRPQDVGATRSAKWVTAQPHSLRLWQTPLRFEGKSVWLASASSPIGGRFGREPDSIDLDSDRSRDDLLSDFLYCQNLTDIGFASGAGCELAREAGVETDGLRAVMIFGDGAVALDEIDFLGWEQIGPGR